MALVLCEVSDGFRDSEATVGVRAFDGDEQFLRVERDFLTENSGCYYLSVGLILKDQSGQFALIELPHEADSGAARLWVETENLKHP